MSARVAARRSHRAQLELLYAQLETLVANAPVGLGLWDCEFRFLHLNEALARINGLPVEDHLGKTVAEVLPDLWRVIEPLWARVLETGEPLVGIEVRGSTRREPAAQRSWLASYYPVRSPGGDMLGIGAVVTDITDRATAESERERLLEAERRAQEALRESEERQRLAVEAAQLGMWFWDLREDRLEWTPRCREMFGFAPDDEVSYQRFLRALHPNDRDRVEAAVRRTLTDRAPYDVEYRVVWPDGTVRWIAAKGHCFVDPDEVPVRMLGVVNDITERKQAAHRATRLQRALAALSGASTVDEVGQAIVEHAGRAIDAQTGMLVLRSEDGETLRLVAATGFDGPFLEARRTIPSTAAQPIAAAVREGRPIFLHSADERVAQFDSPIWLPPGVAYGSGAVLPLLVRDRPIGALGLTFPSRQSFEEAERTFLLTLAGQCAQALERARLYDLERRAHARADEAARRLTRLQIITAALGRASTPEQVCHVLATQSVAELGADAGMVALVSDGGATLSVAAAAGYGAQDVGMWGPVPLSRRVPFVDATRSGQPLWFARRDDLARAYPDLAEFSAMFGQSAAVVPLASTGHIHGALVMAFGEERDWGATDRTFLGMVARQGAEALNRARAYARERRARAEAEAAERHVQQVVDVLPVGLLIADRDGRVTRSNAAVETILGRDLTGAQLPFDDKVASRTYGVRAPDGSPLASRDLPIQRALLDGVVVHAMQHEQRHFITGRPILLLANAAPLRDGAGTIVGAVSAFQDISPIRELERSKDAFLAAVSHDLRNPLAGIHGQAQLLQRRLGASSSFDRDRLKDGARQIEDAADRLTILVGTLLDVARMQAGRPLDLERRTTDLVALAREVASECQQRAPKQSVVVYAEDAGAIGEWDPVRLRRVLENLISNAVKYSGPGGGVIVEVGAVTHEGVRWATVRVVDHGIGIKADDLPNIFEPFFRGQNVPGRIRGTGLSMAASRQVVEQHGGTLHVDSTEGKGTTVTVRLPLAGAA